MCNQTLAFAVFVLIAISASITVEAKAVMDPSAEEVREALRLIQDLDTLYIPQSRQRNAQVAGRVRREDDGGVKSTLLKLSQIKQHYSNVGRPRFGKRDSAYIPGETVDEDYPAQFENAYNWRGL